MKPKRSVSKGSSSSARKRQNIEQSLAPNDDLVGSRPTASNAQQSRALQDSSREQHGELSGSFVTHEEMDFTDKWVSTLPEPENFEDVQTGSFHTSEASAPSDTETDDSLDSQRIEEWLKVSKATEEEQRKFNEWVEKFQKEQEERDEKYRREQEERDKLLENYQREKEERDKLLQKCQREWEEDRREHEEWLKEFEALQEQNRKEREEWLKEFEAQQEKLEAKNKTIDKLD